MTASDERHGSTSMDSSPDGGPVRPAMFESLPEGTPQERSSRNLDLLLDVDIPVAVEIGSTAMSLQEILDLVPGSVVRLGKSTGEPIDLRVNGKLVARGEAVMVDDCYGLRITKIVGPDERLESLR